MGIVKAKRAKDHKMTAGKLLIRRTMYSCLVGEADCTSIGLEVVLSKNLFAEIFKKQSPKILHIAESHLPQWAEKRLLYLKQLFSQLPEEPKIVGAQK
jgi:hypothetical protein